MFKNKPKDTGDKTRKQFEAFSRRLNASKHAFWFEVLHDSKKWELFILWREKLREFEENVRNMAAHKIVSVTKEWIKQYSNGYTPEKIFSMLKEYVQLLNVGIKESYWDSYDAMNQLIIELIKRR